MEWVDQPPPSRGSGEYDKYGHVAAELRAHPSCWAKITSEVSTSKAASRAWTFRVGRIKAFAEVGAWEVVARGYDVYARYVGK